MKTLSMILDNLKKTRIDRLLSNPPSGFAISKAYRRTLCVISVLFSYLYLITLLVPAQALLMEIIRDGKSTINLDKLSPTQSFLIFLVSFMGNMSIFAPLILLTTFLLLRSSMRRVTSLPDEYLDELEIVNRDWAFKTGYLVIRRVGLVFTVISFTTLFILYTTRPRTGVWPSPKHPLQAIEDALAHYFANLTANGALGFYAQIIALLTYVAYAFPIILLAWRESKFNEPLPQIENVVFKKAPVFAKTYFRRVLVVVLGFVLSILIGWFVPFTMWNGLTILSIIATAWFGIYVFIWASVKTVEIIRATKTNSPSSILALTFFVITQILGILIAIFFTLSIFGMPSQLSLAIGPLGLLPIILILGLLMIPMQVLSVWFASKLTGENQPDLSAK